jgi:hypothetical protein
METTSTTPSTARVALKYGLLTALGLIIYSMVIQLAGLAGNQTVSYLGILVTSAILVAGIVYAMKDFKSQNEGFMSYGQGLGLGALTATVSGLISGIFTYIYLTFIDNSAIKQAMDAQRDAMEARGMDDDQIDQAIAMAEKFSSPGMMVAISIISSLFIGFILSLIVSAIMKKERNELEV